MSAVHALLATMMVGVSTANASSVIAASVQAEDVAELARAVCRVALLVESSQDFISISHILWVITRGSATAAEHRSAGVRGGFCRERVDEFSLWSLLPSNDYISWIYRTGTGSRVL